MKKVITFVDSANFTAAGPLLASRKKVDADFFCYAPDLDKVQSRELALSGIKLKPIEKSLYNSNQDALKFSLMFQECDHSGDPLLFVDSTSFFMGDPMTELGDSDLGITYRDNALIEGGSSDKYSDSSVIFTRQRQQSLGILKFAADSVRKGETAQAFLSSIVEGLKDNLLMSDGVDAFHSTLGGEEYAIDLFSGIEFNYRNPIPNEDLSDKFICNLDLPGLSRSKRFAKLLSDGRL